MRALRARAPQLLTVVTSDHGEYFGEDRLMAHKFGLHAAGFQGEPPPVDEAPALSEQAVEALRALGYLE